MRWSRTLQTVDVHCAGEIGRVIASGVLDIPGVTMADKLEHLNKVDDKVTRVTLDMPPAFVAKTAVILLRRS